MEDDYSDKEAKYKVVNYSVTRQVLKQGNLAELSRYDRLKLSPIDKVKETAQNFSFKSLMHGFIPILKWLPEYSVKENLIGDLISGITIAVMHIPQGLGFGLLAGVPPISGLYMAFFPLLVYAMFGTSRHVSIGTFPIVSLMIVSMVGTLSSSISSTTLDSSLNETIYNSTSESVPTVSEGPHYSPIQVGMATAMMVGFFQLIMYVLRLGTLASLLSEPLVNGFTTAAAFHVISSLLKELIGIKIPTHQGAFKIFLTVYDFCKGIPETNLTALYISVTSLIFMFGMNEIVKPWANKKCIVPVPSELIAVVGATLFSYCLNFGPNYAVKLVGTIPVGLPIPELPSADLLKLVFVDSFAITIVSYTVVMSMALIFARKMQYEVRPNQELLAMGLANIVGSFFSCIPIACALSRSMIQYQTGGKTQLSAVISAGLILIILLWVGPCFETLPIAVLAAIIIVALKGMVMQVMDLKKFKEQGILEMCVWLLTFGTVVIIDIDIGLLAGVLTSLLVLYIKGYKSTYSLLGVVPDTDIYVDLENHKRAIPVAHVTIFRFCGSINFASRGGFKRTLFENLPDDKVIRRSSLIHTQTDTQKLQGMRTLILDLSGVAHLDNAGCQTFSEIKQEMRAINVKFYLASPNDCVYDALLKSAALGEATFQIFSSLHDAVLNSHSYSY